MHGMGNGRVDRGRARGWRRTSLFMFAVGGMGVKEAGEERIEKEDEEQSYSVFVSK